MNSKLNLITVPNPRLRLVSEPVDLSNTKHVQLLNDLGEKLVKKSNPAGVGLSAIQIDVPLRVFTTYLDSFDNPQPPKDNARLQLEFYVNPKIIAHSDSVTLGPDPKRPPLEGCLSIPHLYAPVYRYEWIEVEYEKYSPDGGPKGLLGGVRRIRLSGFPARVFQHEYDHLDGILFTDHILGKSPAKAFKFLSPGQNLYYDNGSDLIRVDDPEILIRW